MIEKIPCIANDDCSHDGLCTDEEGPQGCNFWEYPCKTVGCEENIEGICKEPDVGITCKDRKE